MPGRVTYEGFAEAWLAREGEFGEKKPLRLTDLRTMGEGVTLLTYEPAAG